MLTGRLPFADRIEGAVSLLTHCPKIATLDLSLATIADSVTFAFVLLKIIQLNEGE